MTDQHMIKTSVFLIGDPVGHSLSPLIHEYWFNQLGIHADYQLNTVKSDNLENWVSTHRAGKSPGFNVTIPHKQAIMPFLDSISEEAKTVGAVNCVVRDENGKLVGHNTDASALMKYFCQQIPADRLVDIQDILILGAGGAASAAVYAFLSQTKANVYIANRTIERAEGLVHHFARHFSDRHIQALELSSLSHQKQAFDLVINTTSLGMEGFPPLEFDWGALQGEAIAYDIVYRPLETEFLRGAAQKGFRTVDGLGMLIWQAACSFHHWFSVQPTVDDTLLALLRKALNP